MQISKAEIDSFTEVLFQKYGLDFTCYEPQSLQRRMNRVLHTLKCESVHELWSRMLKDKSLLSVFMDEISVGLTSMFREPQVWSGLRSLLLGANQNSLSIWNAGCSTGEEVYTLNIVLRELGLEQKANILATDMNRTAMEAAKSGIFHKIKMVDYEKNYREYNRFGNFNKYYERHDDNHMMMDKSLLSNVRFSYHNLITDPFTGKFDFIFCRNVMIYFDYKAKDRLLQQFYDQLKPGGYFVLGFFDSMLPESFRTKFNSDYSRLRIFRKPADVYQTIA